MRQITFRAWDKRNKRMFLEVNNIAFGIDCILVQPDEDSYVYEEVELDFDDVVLMQYTGLKDYTVIEQEVYEGDILFCNEQQEHLEVFYSDGAFRVQFSFEDENTVLTEKIIKANWLKKVGNVYENEDLI